jgi:N utilization substance protein B
MLNRRLIRIRAMQALYAYKQAEGANFQLALDLIAETFAPNLNSMEFQDREKLEGLKKLSQQIFQEIYDPYHKEDDFEAPKKVIDAVEKAKDFFLLKNKKDVEHYAHRMIIEAEKVYDIYIQILQLFLEIAERSALDERTSTQSKLIDNQILRALKMDKNFELALVRRNVNIGNEQVLIAKLYREVIINNERYQEYCSKKNHTLDEDFSILKYFLKNIILKHEIPFDFFEKQDLYWSEDIEPLRAAVSHTFESLVLDGKLKIVLLDEYWDENKDFLQILFKKSILQETELNNYLKPKLKNWEMERIPETDQILLKMALIEMINYPNIPIKVTINEILEIAKNYSTPKSSFFINGVLDVLSKELVNQGTIRKTGRGMIDNK